MNKIKEIRKKKNLTQLDLAKMTDIYPNDISQIEREQRKAFPGWRKRLSKALEVSEKELFPDIDKEV
jgi:putative transcriptional regulator